MLTRGIKKTPSQDPRLNCHSKLHEVQALIQALQTGADEAFVTSTFGGLTPVTAVDGLAIGSYGPMTKKLQAHYDEAVHRAVDAARPSR